MEWEYRLAPHQSMPKTTAINPTPPNTPAIAGTRTFAGSCPARRGGEEPPEEERDKARAEEFGHTLTVIPWAEHAASIAPANKEPTNEGFWWKDASISSRTACCGVENDINVDWETSTDTSMLSGDSAWTRRPGWLRRRRDALHASSWGTTMGYVTPDPDLAPKTRTAAIGVEASWEKAPRMAHTKARLLINASGPLP